MEFAYPADNPPSLETDLSASRPVILPSSPPPALGALSPGQVRFCPDLRGTVHALTSPRAALGAVRTYGAALKSMAARIADEPGTPVLPMNSEGAAFAFFGAPVLPGPMSVSPSSEQSVVR